MTCVGVDKINLLGLRLTLGCRPFDRVSPRMKVLSVASNQKDYVSYDNRVKITSIALNFYRETGRRNIVLELEKAINKSALEDNFFRTNIRFFVYNIKNAYHSIHNQKASKEALERIFSSLLSENLYLSFQDEMAIYLAGLEICHYGCSQRFTDMSC